MKMSGYIFYILFIAVLIIICDWIIAATYQPKSGADQYAGLGALFFGVLGIIVGLIITMVIGFTVNLFRKKKTFSYMAFLIPAVASIILTGIAVNFLN